MAEASACRRCCRDMSVCCCNGGHLRRRSVRVLWSHSDGVDRISALPDDLLIKILNGLGCARSAAETSRVSKRFIKLWTRLPELVFRDIDPDLLDDALRQVLAAQVDSDSPPPPSLLELRYSDARWRLSPGHISSWLLAAAQLHPANLIVNFAADQRGDVVMLPCLDCAESVRLDLRGVRLKLPPAFDFPKLESLSLGPRAQDFNLRRLLPPFSALRQLSLAYRSVNSIKINHPLVDELLIRVRYGDVQHVDIVAPRLKKLKFDASLLISSQDLRSWYKAPQVDELSCRWQTCMTDACFGTIWYSCHMVLKTPEPFGQLPHCPPPCNLSLYINKWGFGEWYDGSKFFPVANLSILDLKIKATVHAYGAIMLHLLGVYSSVQCLKVYLLDGADQYCYCQICEENCPCHHLNIWQTQGIFLTGLEEVELEGFGGEHHEVDLLEVIFTIARNLKAVTVKLSHMSIAGGQCYRRVRSILEAYPNVRFNIHSNSGQQVLLA